ncbi:hypothetical protein HDU86_007974 [Geranomyces michiganensis]|nr:hypothetical protein HDU86_007974 [Geranomyces michiganensis]
MIYDVLVIGGGPAGLSAALALCRNLRHTVLFDIPLHRNRFARKMHNVPTWDHRDPADYRKASREELDARYPGHVTFVDKEAVTVTKFVQDDKLELFKVTDSSSNEWTGKKIILAVGSQDIYPELEGYGELWGSRIYQCLFCDGAEERAVGSAGVLALDHDAQDLKMGAMNAIMARSILDNKDNVTIFTNGSLPTETIATDETLLLAKSKGIKVDDRKIMRLGAGKDHSTQVVVRFADGTATSVGFMYHKPATALSRFGRSLAEQLKLELTPTGDIKTVGMFNETTALGVFACGDCSTFLKAVPQAILLGTMAGVGAVHQLIVQDP